MKRILALCLLLALPASAQLGKQRHQAGLKYGTPKTGILITKYRKDNCTVHAVLNQGLIVALTYRMTEKPPGWRPRQMTDQELDRYLGHNKNAGAWEKTGPQTWRHAGEGKSAMYVAEDHILYVWENLYATADSWTKNIERWRERGFDDEDEIEAYEFIRDTICKKEP